MCQFCDADEKEREKARNHAVDFADYLSSMASAYRDLAHGHRKPHTDDVKMMPVWARHIVRVLVEEWI